MNTRNFGQQDSGLTRVTFFECQADALVDSLQNWFEPKDRLERSVSRDWDEVWTKVDFPFHPDTHFVTQQCAKWSAHCDNGRTVISGL